MNNLKPEATNNSLRIRDKVFIGLGLTMAIFALFISQSEYTASPSLTWLTFIVGLYLVLRGMKTLITTSVSRLNNALDPFMVYRITRWIVMKAVLLVLLVLEFIFSAIGGDTPDKNNAQDSPMPSSNPREGAWDVASDHYYDKEPPPPFS